MADDPIAVAREPFVLLTTFRRSGEGVSTPVWIAQDGARLVVTTEAHVGKVKRLRADARVTLQPCGRLGRVRPGAPLLEGEGEVLGPDGEHPSAVAALRRKYGVQFRLITGVERLIRRRQGRSGDRVIIAITPAR